MARLHTHSQASLLLIILVTIFIHHPSCEAKQHELLTGLDLVAEVCSHTSNDRYCVNTIIPSPPSSAEGIAGTALGWAQIRALEAGTIITSLLNASSSGLASQPQPFQGILKRCWELNTDTMADLWAASNLFESKTLEGMVDYLYRAARGTRVCQKLLKGTGLTFRRLLRRNNEVIKLSQICVVSTKYFKHPLH